MLVDRRTFLEFMGAAAFAAAVPGMQGGSAMWGMIAKITTVAGKREEMIGALREGAAAMQGCYSYVVAEDAADENVIWVSEVWDRKASHDASLSLPAVKSAIPRAKPLVANFEKVCETTPVCGKGLPAEAS